MQEKTVQRFPSLFATVLFTAVFLFSLAAQAADQPRPFGSNLFQGNFAKTGNATDVRPGDSILVRLWGGRTLDQTFTVTQKLTLDLPDLGSVPLSGIPRGDAEKIRKAIENKLQVAGITGVQVHAQPLDTQAILVFVTGGVTRPGSYQGLASDNILAFLDKAGGIDATRGSYRSIRVQRGQQTVATADLYPFILTGEMPEVRFRDGDTIVVDPRGPVVAVTGDVRETASFEFRQGKADGASLIRLAGPAPRATHVSIQGWRNGEPFNQYLSVRDFKNATLQNDDQVRFVADTAGKSILIEVQGAVRGTSRLPVRRNAHLHEVLSYISIDPDRANLEGLYIKRKSTAARQKKAIADSLDRLEHSAYTASSASTEEAQIRAKEAEMITKFIERARKAEPEGIVVVRHNGKTSDLALEDGDIIVIPEKSDVVTINGEVLMPQAVVWKKSYDVEDYIKDAGGFGNRADTDNILLMHPDGEVSTKNGAVQPGDQILVLPRIESKGLQSIKDISQIAYQVAVACKFIIDF
ncbi:MAG: SLBB domain-containing protein [Desulfovibrio sp.]|nr:SLBB domain-containing protein [Desulfovibrio sp.]